MKKKNYRELPYDWVPTSLSDNEIFVFESSVGAEADSNTAKICYKEYDADIDIDEGPTGHCYGLPTNFVDIEDDFKPIVDSFISYATEHTDKMFLLPRIKCHGCEFDELDIIPLFDKCLDLPNVQMSKEWCVYLMGLRKLRVEAPHYAIENPFDALAEENKRSNSLKVETPKIITEDVLYSLCCKYKKEIASGYTDNLPKIRVRYVIDDNKFGYASFGDFFFFYINNKPAGFYVWLDDDEYADSHNQDMVELVLGDEHHRTGYAVNMIFAGVETPYKDSYGHSLYTGDVVDIKEHDSPFGTFALASTSKDDDDGFYGFPLDNFSLTLDCCCTNDDWHLKRVGTVFFQLEYQPYPETIWGRALSYNPIYKETEEEEKMRILKARYTPNFDQEDWKYSALEILGAEYNWWK